MMLDAAVAVAAASDISLLLSWEIMGAWRAGRVCTMQSNSINMSGRMKEEKPSLPYPSPPSPLSSLYARNDGAQAQLCPVSLFPSTPLAEASLILKGVKCLLAE